MKYNEKGKQNFFSSFIEALKKGDAFVKLSTIWMGAGYFKRKKYFHAVVMTVFELFFIFFAIFFAAKYLSKFSTLGTIVQEVIYNPATMKNEFNDYDNSFLILLYSVLSFVVIGLFVAVWFRNVVSAYQLQLAEENQIHIPTLKEDFAAALDSKFHITLLTLPVLGVVCFTIIPLIVMIAVAFTNYDQQHFPPGALFTWVGLENFKNIFTNSITITFGYSFFKVLGWTLVWAVLATFTCYFGGIIVALLINSKKTRWKKFWRTGFIVCMAVPQFVSLLIVRCFFRDQGILNTLLANVGITELLKNIGLVPSYLPYIPFLTNPYWAKATIIFINIWVGVPYLLLMVSGIMMNIPQDQYEAATIDGANGFQQFIYITMPYLLFVTGPYLINSVVTNINNFNVIFLITNNIYETSDQLLANSHARETDLLVTWLFRLTNDYYNYKMASVIGILVFVVCATITLVAFNFIMKGNAEEAMQ